MGTVVSSGRWVVVLAAVFVSASACSKSSGTPGGAAGSASASGGSAAGTTTTGGTAGASSGAGAGVAGAAGKPSTGPAITEAPAAWSPPADCGGVGDTCPEGIFGCGAASSCQLEGYVCIPAIEAGKPLPSRTAETPYCAAYTCMTFEQASCFCTGEAGKSDLRCSSPAAMAGLCGTGKCAAASECCDGFACLPEAYYPQKSCRQTCTAHEDCASGCCTDALDTGVKICAKADKCETACKVRGEQPCDQGDPNKPTLCCRGTCVLSENTNFGGCRPRCTKNEDCFETGCCEPFDGTTDGFCVDAKFCGCSALGAACTGDDNPDCCSGSTCLSFDNPAVTDPNFTCFKNCGSDADCPGSCCVPLSSGSGSVCGPPDNCP